MTTGELGPSTRFDQAAWDHAYRRWGRHRTGAELDRAAGTALGAAVGDALGAGYEFGSAPLPSAGAAMIGGGLGGFAPGEWTDDTAQAVPILTAAAAGPLTRDGALDEIADGWLRWWADVPADVGIHTAAVLREAAAARRWVPARQAMATSAAEVHRFRKRSAGNGALMRTWPVALACLDDPESCAELARTVAELTHPDPLAGDSCVIWCEAIRVAVLTGTLDGVAAGVELVPAERREQWRGWLSDLGVPGSHGDNGFTVHTLRDALAAVRGAASFADAVQAAVAAGGDTDTVAAVAGALAGARFGSSAVPAAWRRVVHGWPGLRGPDLVGLAAKAALGGHCDAGGWPDAPSLVDSYAATWPVDFAEPVPHPDDPGLLLGTSATLPLLAAGGSLHGRVDAVVSLCRVGRADVPDGVEHVEVWLVDRPEPDANPNLRFVLDDTAALLGQLRGDGATVLLHCVAANSRTPTVAALHGAAVAGSTVAAALARVCAVLPSAAPNAAFLAALAEIDEAG